MNVRVFGLVEGLMVVWDEVKNAAQYHVHLFIGDINKHLETIDGRQTWVTSKEVIKEIALVDVDRNFKYYSFTGLSRIHVERLHKWDSVTINDTGLNYYVIVEAEDRNGNIIDKSDRCSGRVLQFNDAGEK